jgi:hypothetical protein
MAAPKKKNRCAPRVFGSTMPLRGSGEGVEGLHDGAPTAVISASQPTSRGAGEGSDELDDGGSVALRARLRRPPWDSDHGGKRRSADGCAQKEESSCPSVFGSTNLETSSEGSARHQEFLSRCRQRATPLTHESKIDDVSACCGTGWCRRRVSSASTAGTTPYPRVVERSATPH